MEGTRGHGHPHMNNLNNSMILRETTSNQSGPQFHGMDMKYQLHCLERVAYHAVLMAFCAQSDVLSWDKEGLMTELRKELNVTDSEHREVLVTINSDHLVKAIRDWHKNSSDGKEAHSSGMSVPEPSPCSMDNPMPKKLKSAHVAIAIDPKYALPNQPYPPAAALKFQRNSLHDEQYSAHFLTSKKYVSHEKPLSAPAPRSQNYASNGDPYSVDVPTFKKYVTHGEPYSVCVLKSQNYASHGSPYSAVPANLPQLPAECRRVHQQNKNLKGRQNLASSSEGREAVKSNLKECHTHDDGNIRKISGLIQIKDTRKLLLEVERMVFGRPHNDAVIIEKAKLLISEHERSLVGVIAKLSNVSPDSSPNQLRHHYSNENLQGTW